jgi:thiol-disulfide isomerase/thioredoxin
MSRETRAAVGFALGTAAMFGLLTVSLAAAGQASSRRDFFADWCGPCHLLTPKLERLVLNHDKLALRKVDISNWESPAARQATAEFGMPGLPYVRIYDERGQLLGAVHGNHIDQVEHIVKGRKAP